MGTKVEKPNKEEFARNYKVMTHKQLAHHYNVSTCLIVHWIRDFDLEKRGHLHKVMPNREQLIEDLENLSKSKILEKYDIVQGTLTKWKMKYGLTKQKVQMPTKEVLERQCVTMEITEIADFHGVSTSVVNKWKKKLNVNVKKSRVKYVLDPEQLKQDLANDLTILQIARKNNVSETVIYKHQHKHDLFKRQIIRETMPLDLTQRQKEIMNGKLLGDGSIQEVRSENAHTRFTLTHCSAQAEYLKAIHKELKPFSAHLSDEREKENNFKTMPGFEHYNHVDKIYSYCFFSYSCDIFTELRKKWYPQGVKIVPRDLELTWLTLAIWHCDDGTLVFFENARPLIQLCTNGFTPEDVLFLIEKLKTLGIDANIGYTSNKNQPIINISRDYFDHYIDGIAPHVPWECMQYKIRKQKDDSTPRFIKMDPVKPTREVLLKYSATMTNQEIANLLGRCVTTVINWKREYNILINKDMRNTGKLHKARDLNAKSIKGTNEKFTISYEELYNDCLKLKTIDIALKYGRTRQTINAKKKQLGIRLKNPVCYHGFTKEELLGDRDNGMSIEQIAKKYNEDTRIIENWLTYWRLIEN